MGAFFTQIAGQFAKPFFMSALLPVVIVLSLFSALTYPLFPGAFGNPPGFDLLASEWRVAWQTFVVVVAAMLLYVLNSSIIRFFSGYPWMRLFPGTVLTSWRRRQFDALRTRRDGLATLALTLTANDAEKAAAKAIQTANAPASHRLNSDFPYKKELVLPTRLGNILRNAEDYARVQYGISAVPLWPRLLGVIPTDYKEVLSEAKTSFDFAVNTLFLLIAAAVGTMALALAGDAGADLMRAAAWRSAIYLGLAALAYGMTLVRARTWSGHLKASIDLYRKALLEKLGYSHKPVDIPAERATLWTGIVQEWDFPDLASTPVPFAPAPPTTTPTPSARDAAATTLVVARGVGNPSPPRYPLITVTLQVTNPTAAASQGITVTDAAPEKWDFVWGSATASVGAIGVKLTNPRLVFEVDALAAGASVLVAYQIRSLVP